MTQSVYWWFSIAFGAFALLISLVSVRLSLTNRREQRQALLLAKKTELLTKLTEAKGKLGHLAMIYSQVILLIRSSNASSLAAEETRAKGNLNLVLEHSENCEEQYKSVQAIAPTDIEALETHLTVANSTLAHASVELEKEREAYTELKKLLGQ